MMCGPNQDMVYLELQFAPIARLTCLGYTTILQVLLCASIELVTIDCHMSLIVGCCLMTRCGMSEVLTHYMIHDAYYCT